MRSYPLLPVLAAAATLGAAFAAPAMAAERYASPTSTATTPCTSSAPCDIEPAINGAGPGDEVIVAPGTYSVTTPLAPQHPIAIHGVDGQPRPRLTGALKLAGSTLTLEHGETVGHLEIRATAGTQNGLQIKGDGARVERVIVWAAGSHGAKLVPSAATVLRDSVVQTAGTAEVAALKLVDGLPGGTLELTNVTAWAPGASGIGIRCEAVKSTTVIRNTVARGGNADIDASNTGSQCSVSNSNFRADRSPGVTAGSGNQAGEPAFADPAANDFYPTAGSPLIDAGDNTAIGTRDLAGRSRSLGVTVDIGAYERDAGAAVSDPASAGPLAPADLGIVTRNDDAPPAAPPAEQAPLPTPLPTVPPATLPADPPGLSELPPGVTPPVLGRTIVIAPGNGRVLVKLPGGRRSFALLRAGDDVPVRAVVDATAGSVRLSTALGGTRGYQTATFSGGRFEVRQTRDQQGMTDVILRGGDFSKCPRRTKATAAGRRKPVRRIWGKDRNGRFRTRGTASIATVRGTQWLTEDHCHGTLTKVVEGAVDVRDLRTGKQTRVRAGGQKLVRRAR